MSGNADLTAGVVTFYHMRFSHRRNLRASCMNSVVLANSPLTNNASLILTWPTRGRSGKWSSSSGAANSRIVTGNRTNLLLLVFLLRKPNTHAHHLFFWLRQLRDEVVFLMTFLGLFFSHTLGTIASLHAWTLLSFWRGPSMQHYGALGAAEKKKKKQFHIGWWTSRNSLLGWDPEDPLGLTGMNHT